MRKRLHRVFIAAGCLSAGGFLLAGPGTGCSSFLTESALTSAEFCFIFDCQNGLLGGSIDPCSGADPADQSGELPLFTDCPGFQGP